MKYTYDFVEVDGKVPMIGFLDSLSIRERAKILACMEKLVELKNSGILPKENLSKYLDNGIFELRVHFENRISRALYFYEANEKIMFTHGFIKKEQKVSKAEIDKARFMRKSWRGEK